MKIQLLVGLPGSGKTTYGKSTGFLFLDDLTQNGGIKALTAVPKDTENLVVSDFGLVRLGGREAAERILKDLFPGATLEWIWWENDPETCWKNIQNREDGRDINSSSIFAMSKGYRIPKDVTPRSVKY